MNKKVFFAIVALLLTCSYAEAQVKWMSFNKALEAQKKDPKPIFMDVYASWCGPCRLLDKNTFGNKDVAEYLNNNFYPVKFDAEGRETINYQQQEYINTGRTHQFTMALGVSAYPTMVIFDEVGNVMLPFSGYMTPKQIEPILKFVGSRAYKTIKTQEEFNKYMREFKAYSFKE